eukprot:1951871-Pleurochrysis_carterae.AAC.1
MRLKEGDAHWARAAIESGFSRALGAEREHYASARRQFISICRARARVEIYEYLGNMMIKISTLNPPQMAFQIGHGQAFTAVYVEGGICGISPATRSDASDRQL